MSASAQQACASLLITSIALIEQFLKSLDSGPSAADANVQSQDSPSPLLLLTAASNSLKSTTTKLSLLIITAPFTHSAVSSLLKPLNDSILPSLVTATLLTTPTAYPDNFAAECTSLTKNVLRELKILLHLTEKRAKDSTSRSEISAEGKQETTGSTGRVWEACDALIKFADAGVPGFFVKKANQWLALMKDAVQELQDWDPEEEVDPDDIFGLAESDEENEEEDQAPESGDRATISAGVKDQALKVLSRIPQSIHVVVKQRLEKLPRTTNEETPALTKKQRNTINLILKRVRDISEYIDESAEAMYMGNLELCLKKAGEARALTIEVVESVVEPWTLSKESKDKSKEDTYIQRALLWIQQVGADTSPASASDGIPAKQDGGAIGVT